MKRKTIGWFVGFLIIAAVFCVLQKGNFFENISEEEIFVSEEGRLEVHFLDVGQGDATLLLQDGHAMLVDGGDNLHGWQVTGYLNYLGIDHLEYVIATHPDMDHIGGLDIVLQNISCDTVLMPDCERDVELKVAADNLCNLVYYTCRVVYGYCYCYAE